MAATPTRAERSNTACAVCGLPLYRRPSKLARSREHYCSRAHQEEGRRSTLTVPCAYCGAPVQRRPSRLATNRSGLVFCSRSHQGLAFRAGSGIAAVSGPPGRRGHPRGKARGSCQRCRQPRQEALLQDGLCSRCAQTVAKIARWLDGDLQVTYVGRMRDPAPWVKGHLIATRGDQCEVCQQEIRREDGGSAIQMNHRDGNSLNNLIENLELLCPNHHAVTETWGSRNTQPGRRRRAREAFG